MKHKLCQCLKCGSELEYNETVQVTYVHDVLKTGKVSKKRSGRAVTEVKSGFIKCTKCDFETNNKLECKDKDLNVIIWKEGNLLCYEKGDEELRENDFKKLLNDARECYTKANDAMTKAFEEINAAMPDVELSEVSTMAENASNLEEGILCYMQYGESDVDTLWYDLTHRDLEE